MDKRFLSIPYALFAQETLEVTGIVVVADDKVEAVLEYRFFRCPSVLGPRPLNRDEAKPMSANIALQTAACGSSFFWVHSVSGGRNDADVGVLGMGLDAG